MWKSGKQNTIMTEGGNRLIKGVEFCLATTAMIAMLVLAIKQNALEVKKVPATKPLE
jgi:hypothetical protein